MQKGIDYPGVTVTFLCHDGKGNFLFNKRSTNCRDEHGCWDCGGGSVDFGMTVEETVRKEIKEEYRADVVKMEFLGYLDIFRTQEETPTHWVALDFLVLLNRDQVRNGEPHKFDTIGWYRLDALPHPLHSQFGIFIETYAKHIQKAIGGSYAI